MTTLEKIEDLVYRGFKDIELRFQETDRKFEETTRRFEQTDRNMLENHNELTRRFKETEEFIRKLAEEREAKSKEMGEDLRKTERFVREIGRELKGVTDSLGLFAENMVKPAMVPLFGKRGIILTRVSFRASERLDGDVMEIDVVGIGPEALVVTEVKLRLDLEAVEEFLKVLLRVFDFFPYYRGRLMNGAVAGMSIDEGVERYAYKKGLFVLAPSGENMQILMTRNSSHGHTANRGGNTRKGESEQRSI